MSTLGQKGLYDVRNLKNLKNLIRQRHHLGNAIVEDISGTKTIIPTIFQMIQMKIYQKIWYLMTTTTITIIITYNNSNKNDKNNNMEIAQHQRKCEKRSGNVD